MAVQGIDWMIEHIMEELGIEREVAARTIQTLIDGGHISIVHEGEETGFQIHLPPLSAEEIEAKKKAAM
jgi:hypothetical protein